MTRYLPDQLLRDTDSMSMAHALEVRVPLLDDAVVRVAHAVPLAMRLAPGKRCLASAAAVTARPKRPFTLPFAQWMARELRAWVREGVLSDALPLPWAPPPAVRRRVWAAYEAGRVHWSRPWAVAVLRHWSGANGLRW